MNDLTPRDLRLIEVTHDAELVAMKRRNTAREEFVRYFVETEKMFPGKRMPFYAESIWGPKPA